MTGNTHIDRLPTDLKLLWLLAFVAGLNLSTRTVGEQASNPLELGELYRPLLVALVGIALVAIILTDEEFPLTKGHLALLAFCTWLVASAVWSVYPIWTLYRSFEYAVVVVLAIVTGHRIQSTAAFRNWANTVWSYYLVLVAAVWMGPLVFGRRALFEVSDGVLPYILSGVFPRLNPNSVGQIGAILALVGLAYVLAGEADQRKWWIVLGLGGLTMVAAQGRSAMAGFLVGAVVLLVVHGKMRTLAALPTTAVGSIVVLPSLRTDVFGFLSRGQSLEMLLGLSGRIDKWRFAFGYIADGGLVDLLVGYGAFAGHRFEVMPKMPETVNLTRSAHNVWVDLLLDTGLIGVGLFAVVVAYSFLHLTRRLASADGRELAVLSAILAVFSLLLVRGMFTRGALLVYNDFAFMLVLGVVYWRSDE